MDIKHTISRNFIVWARTPNHYKAILDRLKALGLSIPTALRSQEDNSFISVSLPVNDNFGKWQGSVQISGGEDPDQGSILVNVSGYDVLSLDDLYEEDILDFRFYLPGTDILVTCTGDEVSLTDENTAETIHLMAEEINILNNTVKEFKNL